MSHTTGLKEKRKKRNSLHHSRAFMERKLLEERQNKSINVWRKDKETDKGLNYFIVEIKSVKHLSSKDMESILLDRLSDLFEK